MGECWEQKHTRHAQSTKTECDNLYGWIKKSKILPKTVKPADIAGNTEEEEEEEAAEKNVSSNHSND